MDRSKKLILPAVKGRMGDRDYYTTVMRLGDVAVRVRRAVAMPMELPSEKLQRPITNTRVKEVADYLRRSPDRFFNSLVVAMYGPPQWRHFKKFSTPSLEKYAEVMGFLELSGTENMYALDGQHRLFGIDMFLQDLAMSESAAASARAADELVSVIFVEHGIAPKEVVRSRRLFTVLNKKVVKVSKRDTIYLDEDSAMAITVRSFIEEKSGIFSMKQKKVYEGSDNTIPRGETRCFTSIGALYDCLYFLFTKAFYRDKKKVKATLESKRLPPAELATLRNNTEEFFEMLGEEVPLVGKYLRAQTTQEIDEMSPEMRSPTEGGHLLFRPMGLKAFVEIVCSHYEQHTTKQQAYDNEVMRKAIKKAARLPLELSARPAAGVVWVNSKMAPKNFPLLKKVFRHMLKLQQKDDKIEIERQYRDILGSANASLPPQVKG